MGCASSHFLEDEDYDNLVSAGLGHHIVSLTSTTYGILTTLDPHPPPTIPSPHHPPEVINSWELMAGLDSASASTTIAIDSSSSSSPNLKQPPQPPVLLRSIADLDSRIAKPLRALRPLNPNIIIIPAAAPKPQKHYSLDAFQPKCPPGGEMAVVVYITSLRGIRKTFQDCNSVRSALEGVGVRFVERDISMHSGFREELKELMKGKREAGGVPRVFVKGRYIGGAEEVMRIHEEGGLAKLLEELPKGKAGAVCKGCGGARFLPCFECSGSCKVVKEEKVVRCPQCNENGLIVCPICC